MGVGHILDEKGICTKCKRKPDSSWRACPGVHWYVYGNAPDHLSTYSQMRRNGQKPKDRKQPQGCVVTAYHDLVWLYDDREALPRRKETERQHDARIAAWARTQEKYKCKRCGYVPESLAAIQYEINRKSGLCTDCEEYIEIQKQEEKLQEKIERDRLSACQWAHDLLNRTDWAIIDTETTSLNGRVCEIGVIGPDGSVLFESLIDPEQPVTPKARAKHGISDLELAAAPTLPMVWQQLLEVLKNCTTLIAYNSEFDSGVLARSARHYDLPVLSQSWDCAMIAYAEYNGNWSEYHGSYKWVALEGNHRAVGDALAALERMREMASDHIG